MKKTNSNIILIISTLIFLMLVIISVYFYKVIGNKNRHISAVIATLNNKIEEKNNINTLNARMVELGDMSKKIGSYLVNTSEIDTFVEYIENMGIDNDVSLSVKGVEVPKNEKNKVVLTVDMAGSFQNIIKTIALLENAPYNISIISLYLNKEIIQEKTETENTADKSKVKEVVVPPKSSWQASLTFSVLSL